MKRFLVLFCLACVMSCMPMVPTVPVTPDNQAQVTACTSLASTHNSLIIGDFSLGVADTAAAGIAAGVATSNANASKDIGIGATVGAGLVAAGFVLANAYSTQYAASHCADVMGPLPVLPAKPSPDAGVGYSVTVVVPADAGAQ
jgi:hypothetical protein